MRVAHFGFTRGADEKLKSIPGVSLPEASHTFSSPVGDNLITLDFNPEGSSITRVDISQSKLEHFESLSQGVGVLVPSKFKLADALLLVKERVIGVLIQENTLPDRVYYPVSVVHISPEIVTSSYFFFKRLNLVSKALVEVTDLSTVGLDDRLKVH